MSQWMSRLAVILVRSWTCLYTAGMRAETRRRRCAEVESDVWESLHDPNVARARGIHLFVRLTRGMPADVLWRLEHLHEGDLMWRKYALIGLAAAAVTTVAWSLSVPSRDLSLPALPPDPTPIYVIRRRTPPPPPPPPPTWEEFVAKVNGTRPKGGGELK